MRITSPLLIPCLMLAALLHASQTRAQTSAPAAASDAASASNTIPDFYRAGAVRVAEGRMVIQGTLLSGRTVDEALLALAAHPEVSQLWLIDIPGGTHGPERRFSAHLGSLDVFAAGVCFSACAMAALSGRSLTLVPTPGKTPTVLALHGTFDPVTGSWAPDGLRMVDILHARLPAIDKAVIIEALSFRQPNAAGLFIFADASTPLAGGHLVNLCARAPTDCRALPIDSLTTLGIRRSDMDLPAPAVPRPQKATP
ncbi:hypothetical protein ACQ86G_03165 [Roseateles chitinivorans]|uniref:hypothetical protein n=1 Tax=Roseateles chitinivorans TaxID=2917965 RepID=UPI003D67AF37